MHGIINIKLIIDLLIYILDDLWLEWSNNADSPVLLNYTCIT